MQSFASSGVVSRKLNWKGIFPTCTNELVRGGDGFGTMIRVWLDTGGVPEKQLYWCFLFLKLKILEFIKISALLRLG